MLTDANGLKVTLDGTAKITLNEIFANEIANDKRPISQSRTFWFCDETPGRKSRMAAKFKGRVKYESVLRMLNMLPSEIV